MSQIHLKTAITKILIFGIAVVCCLPNITILNWGAIASWQGLFVGVLISLFLGNPLIERTRSLTPRLLSWSVIGLGASMNLHTVAVVGIQGVGYTFVGITLTLLAGIILGRWLAIGKNVAILISVGTAICGGSAIAAVASVIRADDEEISLSLATVFLLNAVALIIFPIIGHHFALSEREFGLWAALAIHDTSSVVGAALGYGNEALAIATTTKLARALWIIPLTIIFGLWISRSDKNATEKNATKKPWFILGFLLTAALVTYVPQLKPAGEIVTELAKRGMVLTLFLIGLGLNRASIARVGLRPFMQGIFLWIIAGVGTLTVILNGWIS